MKYPHTAYRIPHNPFGFTLVELLVVISIIAILTLAGFVTYTRVVKGARDASRKADLSAVQTALEQYYADQFFYPNSPTGSFPWGAALTSSTGNPTPPSPAKTYMNIVPKDPQPSPQPQYRYEKQPGACDNLSTSTRCTSYCIYANLENTPPAATVCTPLPANYNFALTLP